MTKLILDLTDRRRIFFVGDLHGDWKALKFFLEEVGFGYRDAIISVGDLIDRGPDNLEIINFFMWTENAWAVKGNHEDMLIHGTIGGQANQLHSWIANGGEWALDMPQMMIEGMARELDKLPIAIKVRHENTTFGVCHAEVPTNSWDIFYSQVEKHHGWQQKALWGRDAIKGKGFPNISNITYTIHGHSVRTDVTRVGNQFWIDTGSVFDNGGGGHGLTILEYNYVGEMTFHKIKRDHFEKKGLKHIIIE